MTELNIGEDADTWYKSDILQIPASAPLADVYHYLQLKTSLPHTRYFDHDDVLWPVQTLTVTKACDQVKPRHV